MANFIKYWWIFGLIFLLIISIERYNLITKDDNGNKKISQQIQDRWGWKSCWYNSKNPKEGRCGFTKNIIIINDKYGKISTPIKFIVYYPSTKIRTRFQRPFSKQIGEYFQPRAEGEWFLSCISFDRCSGWVEDYEQPEKKFILTLEMI
ncbi:MAG: hypothetical protein KAR54_00655 [Candidatus Pacebacteria bacterium]|nr:hypothetical protein [Candidatus Paceibacterota bacterium]